VRIRDQQLRSLLTVGQVLERRRGPAPTPADQVLDALRDV
jgi:hypothetical protein